MDFKLPILFTLISSSVCCEFIPSKSSLMQPTMLLTCIYPLAISPNQLCLQNVSLLKIIWAFKPKTDFLRFTRRKLKRLQRDQYRIQGFYQHLKIVASPYGHKVYSFSLHYEDRVSHDLEHSLYFFFLKSSLILCFKKVQPQTNSTHKLNEIKHKFSVTAGKRR